MLLLIIKLITKYFNEIKLDINNNINWKNDGKKDFEINIRKF